MELHTLFHTLPRYTWRDISDVPYENGIYIMFGQGETYHGLPRIVRVGTHDAQGRLKKRLKNHYLDRNKDGSIFRKNIGKAILNRENDPYLSLWSLDTSKPENRGKDNSEKRDETETLVSDYLRENITFTVFPSETREQRLRLEEAIIASLHRSPDFGPGSGWLGRYSPEAAIRESGLWLKQGLDAGPLETSERYLLRELCGQKQTPGKPPFEEVWENICAHAGETFETVRHVSFQYRVSGTSVIPLHTGYPLSKENFKRAYALERLEGPGQLNRLGIMGPSYVFAILTDHRLVI